MLCTKYNGDTIFLLLQIQEAQLATRHKTASPLQLKKMYVIIGLLMEQYYEQTKLQASAKTKTESCTGVSVMTSCLIDFRVYSQIFFHAIKF